MINKILVAQPAQVGSAPQYVNLCKKYGITIDFRPFFHIEPVSVRDFRGQGINISDYTAIVFTAKATIDAFFSICKQLRVKIPDSQKYFCTTEGVAFYLQKHIVYRKRKIFYGDGSFKSILKLADSDKHKNERYLIVTPDQQNPELIKLFEESHLQFTTSVMAKFVVDNLKNINIAEYNLLAFYNAEDIKSLKENFPTYKKGDSKIIVFGSKACKAAKDCGLEITIEGPTKEFTSLSAAIEKIIKEPNFKQTIFPIQLKQTVIEKSDKLGKSAVKVSKSASKPAAKKESQKVNKQELKKSVAKKVASKTVAKESKVERPTIKKQVAKKVVAKKASAKSTKKADTKKPVIKKLSIKKSLTKKTVSKKSEIKKPSVKKVEPKKAKSKKTIINKQVAVKAATKKQSSKKVAPKKSVKNSGKKAIKKVAKSKVKAPSKKNNNSTKTKSVRSRRK